MMGLRRRLGSLLAGGALALAPGRCHLAAPPRAGAAPAGGDFAPVGVHPGAADQPTATGRILATLAAWEGRLYAGYGDINANTGPIAIAPFDPAASAFVPEWMADTEAIYLFRAVGARLYAPAIDPKNRADFSVGRPWRDERPVDAYHVYDVATLTGTDLWLVGSQGLDAVAWHSPDGVRWEESLRVRTRSGSRDEFARFYFTGTLDGRLYVQAVDSRSGPQPRSQMTNGRDWQEGPTMLPEKGDRGWHPEVFAGRMVYQSTLPVAGVSRLLGFDGGEARRLLDQGVYDFTVDGRWLFVLGADGAVRQTGDLRSWTTIAVAPATARSVGALDGWIYLGTADSSLLRSRQRLY
jgi:hypothetical protein